MKSVLTVVAVLLFSAAIAFAGSPKNYGKALTLKETTKVSEILAHPETYNGKKVRVEGAVVENLGVHCRSVCPQPDPGGGHRDVRAEREGRHHRSWCLARGARSRHPPRLLDRLHTRSLIFFHLANILHTGQAPDRGSSDGFPVLARVFPTTNP